MLLAVSGGADSMAMLAALCVVVPKERLFCLHVEHGLRPAEESRGDADFVRVYCKEQGIECSVVHIPPGKIASYAQRRGIGIEAAARFFRHRALFREAERLGENTCILFAHTKDDLLETALMRVLRGAGPAGLTAMPSIKNIKRGTKKARIIRPLLSMSRSDVIKYLQVRNLSWREDSTNTDTQFLRNRIRHQLVPLLNEFFPSWKKGVEVMAQTQSLTAGFINNEAQARIKWEINSFYSTDIDNFYMQPLIIREEALFLAIDELLKNVKNPRSVKRAVVRRFCAGDITAADLGPVRIRQEKGKILLFKAQKEFFESGVSLLIKEPSFDNL
ncbi:MAG: tRNA lysidine(34) synthetase TilS [Treponema sp.]|nr:tRNA lysidine(34) synthetase TilS [Treponema sp.]